MFIKTENNELVNLSDKDIVVQAAFLGRPNEFEVAAKGQVGGWAGSGYEHEVRSEYVLFRSPSEANCRTFLNRLWGKISEHYPTMAATDITGGLEKPPMVLHEPTPPAAPKSEEDIPF